MISCTRKDASETAGHRNFNTATRSGVPSTLRLVPGLVWGEQRTTRTATRITWTGILVGLNIHSIRIVTSRRPSGS